MDQKMFVRWLDAYGDAFWDAVEGQRDIHFRYQVLSINGDLGICRWWCEFERISGVHVALDGRDKQRMACRDSVE